MALGQQVAQQQTESSDPCRVRPGCGDVALLGGIFLLLAGEKALEIFGAFLRFRCHRLPFGRESSRASPFVSNRAIKEKFQSVYSASGVQLGKVSWSCFEPRRFA